jgi:tetratricopeptide (TPR) repeat protein
LRRVGSLFLVIILGVVSQAAFAAIWYESYAKAENALHAEQWAEAIRYLNEAIELKSDSNPQARTYGVKFVPYFPYLKLATAYYHMGQLEAASRALDREEQLKAIARSASDYTELKQIRELIRQKQESYAAEAQKRTQGLVSASLEEASRSEAQGKWDEAIVAVNRALALSPDNSEAKDSLARLQSKLSQAEKQREQESRAAAAVKEGEALLADRQYQPAAAKFTEALSIQDSARVRTLLEKTQAKLRTQVTAGPAPLPRQQVVAEALRSSKNLQSEGKLNEALDKLQDALVLDPSNDEVKTLQRTLMAAIAKAAEAKVLEQNVTGLLAQANKSFAAGNFDASLASAKRVLALAPGNRTAIDIASKSIDALNQRYLGKVNYVPKPVIIPFDRQRYQLGVGVLAEKIYRSNYELTGSVNYKDVVRPLVRLEHFSSFQEFSLKGGPGGIGQPGRGVALEAKIRVERQGETVITQYVVPHVLEPGLSLFLVTAEDTSIGGASQNSSYLVYYVRPFYAAGWFLGSLGGLLTALACGFYGLKRQRSRMLSKRRFNPYVAGAPVLQDYLFFGREQLLKSILQSIHNNSIMLFGERRIGKTSLQHHLKKRLAGLDDPEYSFYSVYIDLQGIPQERFFATLRDEIFRELTPLLGSSLDSAAPPDGSAYDYRDLVDDIRRVLKMLETKSNKKVKLVLQMDEVDQLNSYDPRVNQRLRSLFMRNFSENLASVVSGVAIQKQWDGEGSPWYNFFEEIEVKPLSREDAERLIVRPVEGRFRFEKGAAERIIEVTGCKPYLIQKMCIALINNMHAEGRRTVTLAEVEAIGRPTET